MQSPAEHAEPSAGGSAAPSASSALNPGMRAARQIEAEALMISLKQACVDAVAIARAGKLQAATAQRLINGTLIDAYIATRTTDGDEDEDDSLESLQTALASDRPRVLRGLRSAFTSQASWALFTVEWMDSLVATLGVLGARSVLEVCSGLNVLARSMRERGLLWKATEQSDPKDAAAEPLDQVCGALDALSLQPLGTAHEDGVHATAVPVDVVFFSWWSGGETDEDYLLVTECLEKGVPVIFVGEGAGGCTGSSMLWTSGLPIVPLAQIAQTAGLEGFVDVPNWEGCSDRSWFVDPRGRPDEG